MPSGRARIAVWLLGLSFKVIARRTGQDVPDQLQAAREVVDLAGTPTPLVAGDPRDREKS